MARVISGWPTRTARTRSELVDCRPPCVAADGPAWSPHGTSIAYTTLGRGWRGRAGSRCFVAIDPETQSREGARVDGEDSRARHGFPALVARRASARDQCPEVLLRGEDGRFLGAAIGIVDPGPLVQAPKLITGWDSVAGYPDWNPSENLIVFQGGSDDPFTFEGTSSNLFTVETRRQRPCVSHVAGRGEAVDRAPCLDAGRREDPRHARPRARQAHARDDRSGRQRSRGDRRSGHRQADSRCALASEQRGGTVSLHHGLNASSTLTCRHRERLLCRARARRVLRRRRGDLGRRAGRRVDRLHRPDRGGTQDRRVAARRGNPPGSAGRHG